MKRGAFPVSRCYCLPKLWPLQAVSARSGGGGGGGGGEVEEVMVVVMKGRRRMTATMIMTRAVTIANIHGELTPVWLSRLIATTP